MENWEVIKNCTNGVGDRKKRCHHERSEVIFNFWCKSKDCFGCSSLAMTSYEFFTQQMEDTRRILLLSFSL